MTSMLASAGPLGLAIGAATVIIYSSFKYIQKKKENTIPKTWNKVGIISDIFCFPVKSCGPLKVKEAECQILGLRLGCIRDRTFMIVKNDGNFLTGRQQPTLTQVVPEIFEGTKLKLCSPLMSNSLILELDALDQLPNCKAKVWDQEVDVVHCGEEAAKWFSKLLNIDGLYLVYYPLNHATRSVRPNNIPFKDLIPRDCGAFPDATSFMMISEDSIDKLNEKLKTKVTPLHFRPNFVIRGSEAFAEDNWRWLRFGKNGPIFKVIKPCTRCIFTTIDPANGIKDPDMEPLKTLKKFRQLKDKVLRKASDDRPVMGIHLAFITGDRNNVNLHDNVYIGSN